MTMTHADVVLMIPFIEDISVEYEVLSDGGISDLSGEQAHLRSDVSSTPALSFSCLLAFVWKEALLFL